MKTQKAKLNGNAIPLEQAIEILTDDQLRQIEIDTFQICKGCIRACSHCSQDPEMKVDSISALDFTQRVNLVQQLSEKINQDMFTKYLLTSTDSDPFLNPNLAGILAALYTLAGKKFYVLTSGWYENKKFQENAEWIAQNPFIVERVALTLSNFPLNPVPEKNREILVNAVKTLGKMPAEKFVISPQYNAEASDNHPHSKEQVMNLLEYVLREAGYSSHDFAGRIHPRAVIGLGRALTQLGVQKQDNYRIEAEEPLPVISIRETEKPYSGMINIAGDLVVLKSRRAMLNRDLASYHSPTQIK